MTIRTITKSKRIIYLKNYCRNYLDVKSGSRGVFGVPFYEQSFGHGDRIFLDFILASKPNYKSIVEFGTFKGLTSFVPWHVR